MCGIVGVTGSSDAIDVVLNGLKRLEYRGYDSAGIACVENGKIDLRKAKGKISELEKSLNASPLVAGGGIAIGHTRWATHGIPSETNAHPHATDTVAVVHNGIIENFETLRTELKDAGYSFKSQTDSETIPVLLSKLIKDGKSKLDAVVEVTQKAEGAFALGIMFADDEDTLFATRRGAPLVVGLGKGKHFIGSDPVALAAHTNRFMFLEDDDVAQVTPDKVTVYDKSGKEVKRPKHTIDLSGALAGKAGYPHFMLKEIHEQPDVISRMLSAYLTDDNTVTLPQAPFKLADVPQISMIACGTAYYACLTGKYMIEKLTGVPVHVDVASEFRYRTPPLQKDGLFVAVSQSGETADTLAALEHARAQGQKVLAITNTPTSSIARASDVIVNLMAETEVAVASTKAFMGMLTAMALVALEVAKAKQSRSDSELQSHAQALRELPAKLTQCINQSDEIKIKAKKIKSARSMLYLGRGALFPLACEGALKMKEITYIHAEAYASGEMKHGPIALVDESWPVVNLAASNDGLFEKTVSNMKEIQARQGQVILITDPMGEKLAGQDAHMTITVPDSHPFVQPMVFAVPLQLLAYHTAVIKGTDVDQPRNLAKSVTVE